jgi:hypothetical protein
LGIFCVRSVFFMVIWYIFPVLVCCTKKNPATLVATFGEFVAAKRFFQLLRKCLFYITTFF